MSTYSTTVLADGATAYWKLGETSGTSFTDSGAQTLTGTSHGSPTLNQTGGVKGEGGAVLFAAGSSQYIDSASSPYLALDAGGSVEFWVYVTAALNAVVVSRATASNFEWGVEYDKDNSRFIGHIYTSAQGNISTVYSSGSKALNTWYHVVMTWDGNVAHNAELYVNGAVDHGGGQTTPGGTTYTRGTSGIQIARYGNGVQYFTGNIMEVAVYQTVLTLTQVNNHYNIGLGNITLTPPVAGTTTYTGQVPVLAVPDILPPTGTLTYAGLVPTVSGTVNITPPAGAITYAGFVPSSFGGSSNASPPTGTFTYTGLVPTFSEAFIPPTGAITYAGLAPTLLVLNLTTQCEEEFGTAYSWHSIVPFVSGGTDVNQGWAGVWWNRVDWANTSSSDNPGTMLVTVPSSLTANASFSITVKTTSFGDYELKVQQPDSQGGTILLLREATEGAFPRIGLGTTTTYTLTNLAPGTQFFVLIQAVADGVHTNQIDTTELCLTALMSVVNNTVTGLPIATTTTYAGLAPVGVTVGPTPSVPLGAISYAGITPSLLINGALIILAPFGSYSLVGVGPAILGTTSTVNIYVIPGGISYSGLSPGVFPDFRISNFIFISEDYIGYTALDAVPLASINAGSLLHGQTKIMRFRLGNTSKNRTTFTLSAVGHNQNLVSAVQFSSDNYTWANSLTFENVVPNGVTDIVFMRIITPQFATIGVGSYLVDVDQTYA